MSEELYDLVVIGGGPGGYVAAIRASQLGMKVAVVESRARLGGVCLNEGCIPSKALLDSSELFLMARDKFSSHGIEIPPPKLNLPQMIARKDDVVKKLTDGVAFLFKKNRIALFSGTGRLTRSSGEVHDVVVSRNGDEPQTVRGRRVLIATGSESVSLPTLPFDGEMVIGSREALEMKERPERLVIVGGGYIGLEMASIWSRLGTEVTIVEMLPAILPTMDQQCANNLKRLLERQKMKFLMEAKVTAGRREGNQYVLVVEKGGQLQELWCDRVLVSVGRRPLTKGLGLEEAGVKLDSRGRIDVDENYRTNVPCIYAIGDVIKGPMLAHKASEEGVACVERMAGQHTVVEYEYVPGIVYTWPELASVGKTEEQLKEQNVPYDVGRFNFGGNGRAKCMGEQDGFVKILAHQETGQVLGVHILGPRASDMIAEAVAVMSFEGTAEDIALTFHAHPTLAEAMKEAALDVKKEAIHA